LIAVIVFAVVMVGDARRYKSAKQEAVARTLRKITALMREEAAQTTNELLATGETSVETSGGSTETSGESTESSSESTETEATGGLLATNEAFLQHEEVLFEQDAAAHGGEPTTEGTYEVTGLELAMCGEFGIGGAFWAAYQHEPEEGLVCPKQEDFIWGFVLQQPNVVCLMAPQDLRNGFECVRRYFEENPITYLYHLMQIITASLPQEEPAAAPADMTTMMKAIKNVIGTKTF